MARKTDSTLLNNAIELIRGGETVINTSKVTGISTSVLRRAVNEFGITTPEMIERERLDKLGEDMVTMYQNGESENAVAKHFSVSRNVVRRHLKRLGVEPRTQSQAEALKWSKMTEEQRRGQVEAAHKSSKGRPKTDAEKITIAKARESIKYDFLIGPGETKLSELLTNRGIDNTPQKAVKFYNVDIAVGSVAVELTMDRSRYTMFNPKEIKRAKNLLECGYHTLAIQFDSEETLIECADYIITTINEMSSLEPFTGEYWVIDCRTQDSTVVKNELGKFTSVPTTVQIVTKRSIIQL